VSAARTSRPYDQITEKQLREQIRDLVKIYGWRMAFTQFSMMSPKGFPDLCLARPPRLVFAELKSEKGKTTPEQEGWLQDLRRISECGYVAGPLECVMVGRHAHAGVEARRIEVYLWRPSQIEHIAEVLR
jgi:hypothetical protein